MRPTTDKLLAEECSPELPGLPRREPWLLEHLHDFIRELSLFRRKWGRIGIPAQTSQNIGLDPRVRWRELVRELVQLAHLLEQRLELPIVDRHDRTERTPLNDSYALAPLVLAHEDSADLGEVVRAILEPTKDLLTLLDVSAIVERFVSSAVRSVLAAGSSTRCANP